MLSCSNRVSAKRTVKGIFVKRRFAFCMDLNLSRLAFSNALVMRNSRLGALPKPSSCVHSFWVPTEKLRPASGVKRLVRLKISDSRRSVISWLFQERERETVGGR